MSHLKCSLRTFTLKGPYSFVKPSFIMRIYWQTHRGFLPNKRMVSILTWALEYYTHIRRYLLHLIMIWKWYTSIIYIWKYVVKSHLKSRYLSYSSRVIMNLCPDITGFTFKRGYFHILSHPFSARQKPTHINLNFHIRP